MPEDPAKFPEDYERFVVKDSGKRAEYASGMVRDTQEGKPDYTLLPLEFLERWAHHMTKGAVKYGRDNWRKANSSDEFIRFRGSAFRHLIQWLAGDEDEDHASAVCFNVAAAEYVRDQFRGDIGTQNEFTANATFECPGENIVHTGPHTGPCKPSVT